MKKLLKGEALMLRTCQADGTSYNGFKWPKSGPVTCPDWKPNARCGHGLHGLLWGEGDGSLLDWSETAAWLVVRVKESEAIQIDRKVKVPGGVVEFFGARMDAIAIIQKYAPAGCIIVSGTATAGDRGTATAGYRGTATAGADGVISIQYRNGEKHKRAVFAVGENGIEPNQPYRVDEKGQPIKVAE